MKTALSELNKQVFNYISDNNYDALNKMFTDSLRDQMRPEFYQKFMPQIQHVIKGHEYKLSDEFYIRTAKHPDSADLAGGDGENAYTMKLKTVENETFISMLVAGDTVNEVMITIFYSKINGNWKVANIKGEDYSLCGKNAIELNNYAMQLEKKGDLIDAFNIVTLMGHCLRPGGSMFRYKMEDEIKIFTDSLIRKTNARFALPYEVKELASKPKVVNIHMEVMDRAFVPMIMYQSSIWVNDTVTLKKENDEMKQKIGSVFQGIDKNNKTILYRAYNELPDGKNSPPYYGFVQKIN